MASREADNLSEEQIRRVFGVNQRIILLYFSIKTYVVESPQRGDSNGLNNILFGNRNTYTKIYIVL